MDKLKMAREEIDIVDREMAKLFIRRMHAVGLVSEHKLEHGLPVYDAAREDAVIRKNVEQLSDDEFKTYYVEFIRDVMKISRQYQARRMEGLRAAFSGVEGAFASIAAYKIFPDATRVPHPDFEAAYNSVVNGDCDVAVLPIENSTAGEVGQVLDMLFFGSLSVTGVYDFPITQHLLGLPEATIGDIREVCSHPQALAQCAAYIKEHGFEERRAENTAIAARSVAKAGDIHTAAIASEETATLYGLKILEKNINEIGTNTTRFAVLSRAAVRDNSKDKHSILMFTVRNEAGSLAKAIHIIGSHGFNMRCLRSRPTKELLWEYYFYVELEGNMNTDEGKAMCEELASCCDKLKVLGSFGYSAKLD